MIVKISDLIYTETGVRRGRQFGDGRFLLCDGHYRLAAAEHCGHETVPVLVLNATPVALPFKRISDSCLIGEHIRITLDDGSEYIGTFAGWDGLRAIVIPPDGKPVSTSFRSVTFLNYAKETS